MDIKEVREWEQAVDAAEMSPLTVNLPATGALGAEFVDEDRKWVRVRIIGGNVGGRWAYWHVPCTVAPRVDWSVIADKIFNGDAHHFVGMLAIPFVRVHGVVQEGWVLVEPRVQPPAPVYERAAPVGERYEKSREVFDVDTGKVTPL